MNLVTKTLSPRAAVENPQSFLKPHRESTSPAGPADVMSQSYTPDQLEKRLLEVRTRARKDGRNVTRAQAAASLTKTLGAKAEGQVVATLDTLKEQPQAGPVKESLKLLRGLDVSEGDTERAAHNLVEILKQDPRIGGKTKAGFEFAYERVDSTSEETSSVSLLNALDAQDSDAELIHRFSRPGRLNQDAKALVAGAHKNGAASPTAELGLAVFGGWSPDESALGAFFETKSQGDISSQRAARVLDGVLLADDKESRQDYLQAAYHWMSKETPIAKGHTNLRVAAIAEENSWTEGGVLRQGLESVAEGESWLSLARKVLPEEGLPTALRRLRNGLEIEADKDRKAGAKGSHLDGWGRVVDVLADVTEQLPQDQAKPFLDQALKTAENQEKPDLKKILSSTLEWWFPDMGYRTDTSHVPRVLMALKESDSVSKEVSRMASAAHRSVETMGGSQARAELMEGLGALTTSGLKTRPVRRSTGKTFIGDHGVAVIAGILGGCAAMGLGLVLGPGAGLLAFGASTAGSVGTSCLEIGRKDRMKISHPGSTLYTVPQNSVSTYRKDMLFT